MAARTQVPDPLHSRLDGIAQRGALRNLGEGLPMEIRLEVTGLTAVTVVGPGNQPLPLVAVALRVRQDEVPANVQQPQPVQIHVPVKSGEDLRIGQVFVAEIKPEHHHEQKKGAD